MAEYCSQIRVLIVSDIMFGKLVIIPKLCAKSRKPFLPWAFYEK